MNAPREPLTPAKPATKGLSLLELLTCVESLQKVGDLDGACQAYIEWLEGSQDPMRHAALFNLASIHNQLGRFPQAEQAFLQALALEPGFGPAHINLGLMYERLGNKGKALAQWNAFASQRFLSRRIDSELLCTALNHIGRLQENEKAYDLAEQALRESLKVNPNQPGVVQHWVHIRQKACMWPVYESLPGLPMPKLMRYTSPLGMLALTDDPAVQLLTSQNFVVRMYGNPPTERLSRKLKVADGRKKVGIVSADLREHAVGFLLPTFLRGRDRSSYELYAYDFTQEESTALRAELRKTFDHFIDIRGLSDRQAAQRVADDGIDILIDLHGLSAHARPGIFALRPAPLQGTYLGFIGPTGMPWLDFVIADRDVLPPETALFFTETPIAVDGSFIPLDRRQSPLPEVQRSDLGLPEHAFLMAAFGNVYKITPDLFAVWMSIMRRIPQAILCLIQDNPVTVANLHAAARRAGIDADRVRFLPRVAHPQFCARLRLFDVFLDTYPYNCGSTSSDVLNAGVPMVSRYGRTMVSRMGLSILRHAGLEDLAVDSFEAYEDKVLEIALRRQARPDRQFASRSGSMFNQAMERILRSVDGSTQPPASDGPIDAPGARPEQRRSTARPSISLQLHPLDPPGTQDGAGSALDADCTGAMSHLDQMRHYLLNRPVVDDGLVGFYTDEGLKRLGLSHRDLENAVLRNGPGVDLLGFSPWWDLGAFSLNPFQLARARHPGALDAAQRFATEIGLGVDLSTWTAPTDTCLHGVHFAARRKVWMRWLEFAHRLMHHEDAEIAAHREVIYRLLGNFLMLDERVRVRVIDAFLLKPWDPAADEQRRLALTCNALKGAFNRTGQRAYLDEYARLVARAGCTDPDQTA